MTTQPVITIPSAVDPKLLRQTVGRFLTGVTVIVCAVEGELLGMTANSFTSLSLDPPLVLFCPGKHTRTGQNVASIETFSVNVLREDQQPLSNYFAGGWKQPEPPPFRFVQQADVPYLEGSLATLLCRTYDVVEGGDHWIVIGEVVGAHQGPDPLHPLGFHMGRYATIEKSAIAPSLNLYNKAEQGAAHHGDENR